MIGGIVCVLIIVRLSNFLNLKLNRLKLYPDRIAINKVSNVTIIEMI